LTDERAPATSGTTNVAPVKFVCRLDIEILSNRNWFRKYDANEWDQQIEEDIQMGKLDKLAEKAFAAHKAERTKEF